MPISKQLKKTAKITSYNVNNKVNKILRFFLFFAGFVIPMKYCVFSVADP